MSIFKNNWLWDFSGDDDKKAESVPPPAQSTPTTQSTYKPAPPTSAEINPKFSAHFEQLMQEANDRPEFKGPDYREFSIFKKKLAQTTNLSERDMIQAAVATGFLAADVDPQIIIDTADRYIRDIFEPDRKDTMNEIEKLRDETIGSKLRQIEALKAQKVEAEATIAKCTAEINALTGEVSAQEEKLKRKEQEYNTAYDAHVAQIRADQEKVKKYVINKS